MDLVLVYEGDQGTWTRRSFAKTKIEARYQGFFVLWECELSRYVWRMKKKTYRWFMPSSQCSSIWWLRLVWGEGRGI